MFSSPIFWVEIQLILASFEITVAHLYEIGVLRISVHDQPVNLLKNTGKLKKSVLSQCT
jgi:hypothetical protein